MVAAGTLVAATVTTNVPDVATSTQNPATAGGGGGMILPPSPQHTLTQPPTVPQPKGLRAVLTHRVVAADDVTYACNFKWQADVNGDTNKCKKSCE